MKKIIKALFSRIKNNEKTAPFCFNYLLNIKLFTTFSNYLVLYVHYYQIIYTIPSPLGYPVREFLF